jgi:uncharacterized membrane protein YjjB (DUF3815 family)
MLSFSALLQAAFLSFWATFGFAMLYRVPRTALLPCSVIGMTGYVLRTGLHQLGFGLDSASFAGAFWVSLVGTWVAKRFELPLVLFTITGIICMVPGIPAFKVLMYFKQNDLLGGLQSAVTAGFSVMALVSGIGAARILTDSDWAFEERPK